MSKELKDNENIPKQTRETKGKGVVKVSTVTATLVSAFFMWCVTEFGENREENDVTKLYSWMQGNPKINEEDFLQRLRLFLAASAQFMSMADVLENNLLKPDPESVIFSGYYFLRKFAEMNGDLADKNEVREFNKKYFRKLFNSYENTPLFRKHYKRLFRIKGNDDVHKYRWQQETENRVKDKYHKITMRTQKRQTQVAPKLYLQANEILERVFHIVQELKQPAK